MRTVTQLLQRAAVATAMVLLIPLVTVTAQITTENLEKIFRWRNIGPANMSGRITDIEALDADYRFVVVASASGGVWKSVNAGTTWEPIFDNYGSASIGSVAIFQPNPDIIWVGTGEPNNRNSVAWGDGIYRSTDGGETFDNMGLEDTHQISHVLTHPTDPDIVYVGAIGHLWGFSGDRGVFKTTDGGETWERVLYNGRETGCSALVMDPTDPQTLYAGMYQRLRQPWRYDGGGPNGGIFKSTDGGQTWQNLTNGLPPGDTGKIGLAISRSDPNTLAAFVEAEQLPRGETVDPADPKSGIYRSEDAGATWTFMNSFNNRPFYYSHIFLNPENDRTVYLVTGSFQISEDGGTTLQRMGGGIHGDYHAMWSDPHNPERFYIGNDGGVSLTHDHSASYIFFDHLPLSQFYAVGVDMRDPYYVYGGLQDNGSWGGPSNSRERTGILTDHWYNVGGGDGFHCQVDPTDWRTVYVESQGGSISRVDALTRQRTGIRPGQRNVINYDDYVTDEILEKQDAAGWGRSPFRFNWSAPIVLSPHNPRTVFFGGNVLFKSVDRGDSWMIISPDLTTDDPVKIDRDTGGLTADVTGAENHCAIITVSESPLTPGLIWVGTDDGNVQITRNGGASWTNVRSSVPGVPDGLWVSRVEASHFDEGTCYLSFDGHRSDDFTPWVFSTSDYGLTWTRITDGIPGGHCIYVVREDLKNPDLLFAGTEFGCFVSLDRGASWHRFMSELPTVAVHDLVIHPRENDLIAATHGRGIWICDDISALQLGTADARDADAQLFEPKTATQWLNINRGGSRGSLFFQGENPAPGALISFWLRASLEEPAVLTISDLAGTNQRTWSTTGSAGFNMYLWDMTFDPTEQMLVQFIERLGTQLDSFEETGDLTRAQRRQIRQIREALEEEQSNQALMDLRQQFMELRGFGGGGGFRGGGGGLRGPSADPGIYLVKLIVNGEEFTTTLTIREDPLLSGGR